MARSNEWTTGLLVYCETVLGHIAQDLAINSVSFDQNDHTASVGAIEIPRAEYLRRLRLALKVDCSFA